MKLQIKSNQLLYKGIVTFYYIVNENNEIYHHKSSVIQ